MEFTGERYVPSVHGQIRHEHIHRYAWCLQLVAGKDVLDIACGEGYGSDLLARTAKSVVGVDISAEVVAHAEAIYGHRGNLRFVAGDAASIPLPDACVDVVVSFETIEHHDRHTEMLAEFKRVLKTDGMLVISTPNRLIYSDLAGYHNEFHVKELYFDEFDQLLKGWFGTVSYFGQRLATGSTIYPLDSSQTYPTYDAVTDTIDDVELRTSNLADPVYFIAVATASAAHLPSVRASALFSEVEDLYLHHMNVARWAQERDQTLRALEQRHAELQAEHERVARWAQERDQTLHALELRHAERPQLPASAAGHLAELGELLKTVVERKNATIESQRAEIQALQDRQNALYEQLVRAEAQLDLLKQMVLPEAGSRLERL